MMNVPMLFQILNRRCVEAALISAVTLSARVNRVSYFDRKHYFYPDLPVSFSKIGVQMGRVKRVILNGRLFGSSQ